MFTLYWYYIWGFLNGIKFQFYIGLLTLKKMFFKSKTLINYCLVLFFFVYRCMYNLIYLLYCRDFLSAYLVSCHMYVCACTVLFFMMVRCLLKHACSLTICNIYYNQHIMINYAKTRIHLRNKSIKKI